MTEATEMTKEEENIKTVQTDSKRETLTTKRDHDRTSKYLITQIHGKHILNKLHKRCCDLYIFFKSSLKDKIHLRYLSTAIATSVKTEADTEMP